MTKGFLGLLMLRTRFPRLPGDVGHPGSFSMRVVQRVVDEATPQRAVRDADPLLLPFFIEAAQALVAQGAVAISTSCGFLVRFQHALQRALPVPVWTSSLLKLPELARPGVITVDARSLDVACLLAAGADPQTPVEGLAEGCALQRTLLEDLSSLDVMQAEVQVLAAARRLLQRYPGIDALVLECTNLPPYAPALERATGLPVHHLVSLVDERFAALK